MWGIECRSNDGSPDVTLISQTHIARIINDGANFGRFVFAAVANCTRNDSSQSANNWENTFLTKRFPLEPETWLKHCTIPAFKRNQISGREQVKECARDQIACLKRLRRISASKHRKLRRGNPFPARAQSVPDILN